MPSSRERGRHEDAARGRRRQLAANLDLATGRVFEARDAAQRRGLAAAGRAEQHDDLACRHGEADAIDRRPGRSQIACAGR